MLRANEEFEQLQRLTSHELHQTDETVVKFLLYKTFYPTTFPYFDAPNIHYRFGIERAYCVLRCESTTNDGAVLVCSLPLSHCRNMMA